MAPSLPGHSTPSPSSDQNVPKVVSRIPTTNCRRLRGIRDTGPWRTRPIAPMMITAPTPPITAGPSWFALAPNETTMNATSRPSSTTPLNDSTNASQSNPSPLHSGGSSSGCRRMPARPWAATRMTPLRNHCRPKTRRRAPTTSRSGPMGTRLSARPRAATTTASTAKPAPSSPDAEHDRDHFDGLDRRGQEGGDQDNGCSGHASDCPRFLRASYADLAHARMRSSRPGPGGHRQRGRLRGLPQDRGSLGAPATVHDLRTRRLLRQLAEQTRDRSFPSRPPRDHEIVRAGRGLGLVLRGRGGSRSNRLADPRPRRPQRLRGDWLHVLDDPSLPSAADQDGRGRATGGRGVAGKAQEAGGIRELLRRPGG